MVIGHHSLRTDQRQKARLYRHLNRTRGSRTISNGRTRLFTYMLTSNLIRTTSTHNTAINRNSGLTHGTTSQGFISGNLNALTARKTIITYLNRRTRTLTTHENRNICRTNSRLAIIKNRRVSTAINGVTIRRRSKRTSHDHNGHLIITTANISSRTIRANVSGSNRQLYFLNKVVTTGNDRGQTTTHNNADKGPFRRNTKRQIDGINRSGTSRINAQTTRVTHNNA